jgi:mannose-6-phosphate isomerase-like protein (cupin superfamily)
MNVRASCVVGGVVVLASACGFAGGRGKRVSETTAGSSALEWTTRLNETRGPVRAADVSSPLGNKASSEILAGPANGSDNGYLLFTRMAPGAQGPALFTLPDNHLLVVLEGKMSVQIGTDTFVAEPWTAVVLPRGIPHRVWNADVVEVRALEVIAPGSSRDLVSMLTPAQPTRVENAAQYIRKGNIPVAGDLKPGLNGYTFASRKLGTAQQMRIDSTLPGSGGPRTHVHKFQQVYFEIEGKTTLTYGLLSYELPKYAIGIIPPGVVHTNNNHTTAAERHVTLLLDELADPNEPLDIEVEFKGAVGGTGPASGQTAPR